MNRCLHQRLAVPLVFTLSVLSTLRADPLPPTITVPVAPWSTQRVEEKYRPTNNDRTSLLPPLRAGEGAPVYGNEPTDEEIRRAMAKHDVAILQRSTNVKFAKERLVNQCDEPQSLPLVGMAQLYHGHWKCTVTFTEQIESPYPFPMKWSKDHTRVVYVDKDHLHVLGSPSLPREFAFVPAKTSLILSARVADLFRKLDLQPHSKLLITLNALTAQMGINLEQVERCTFVMGVKTDDVALLFAMKAPTTTNDLLGDDAATAKKMTHAGQDYYLCPARSMVVTTIDARTVLMTTTDDTMKNCLSQSSQKQARSRELEGALLAASTHDVFGYIDLSTRPMVEGVTIPQGVSSATVGIHIGARLDLQMRIVCDNAQALAWSKKTVQSCTDLVRAQLAMYPAMVGLIETGLVPHLKDDFGIIVGLPVKLMQRAEKGLQKPTFGVEGTNLTMNVAIPLSTNELRSEFVLVDRFLADQGAGLFLMQTHTKGMTLPSGRYLEHNSPQYVPADPQFPLPKELHPTPPMATPINVGPTPLPAPAPVVSALPPSTPLPPLPPPSLLPPTTPLPPPTLLPPHQPSYLPPPTTMPPASAVLPVAAVYPAGPMTLKITVANVHSQSAHIFEHVEQGKPVLLEKVAAGQAVDLKLKSGQRCVAVFTDKETGLPTLLTFTAEKPDSIWLLRPHKD